MSNSTPFQIEDSTWRLPGLIDTHVHLRDPGETHKEDFYTGTLAALSGGFTTVIDMPNNVVPVLTIDVLKQKEAEASKKAVCDFGFHLGVTEDSDLEVFEKISPYVVGLKIYLNETTGKYIVSSIERLEEIFSRWNTTKPILVHAEGETIERAITLATKYGNTLHVCHISTKYELQSVMQAKKEGINITCEVTPHHLFLSDDNARRLGPLGLVKPPLQSKKDQAYLWDHLDAIDTIATDHAPHTLEEKQNSQTFGFPGLETALPLMITAMNDGRLTLDDIVRLMSSNPSKIFDIPSDPQTYIEVDMHDSYEVSNSKLKTKCHWSPFEGWKVKGRVKTVYIRGTKAYENGDVLVEKGFGKNVVGI